MRVNIRITFVLLLTALALPAVAQVSRGGGEGMARLQAMLQQERARAAELTAENERLKQDAKKTEAALAAAESRIKSLERSENKLKQLLARIGQSNDSARSALETSRSRFQELLTKSREIAGNLRESEGRADELEGQLVAEQARMSLCTSKNDALVALNEEILAAMDDRDSTWAKVLRREPFTQVKRVQLENLVDEYRYRAEDLVVLDAADRE